MGSFRALLVLTLLVGQPPWLHSRRIVADRVGKNDLSTDELGHGNKDPVFESLVHRCVEARASDFTHLLKRLEMRVPRAAPETHLNKLVDDIVAIKDMETHRYSSRSAFSKLFHWDSYSSNARTWQKQLEDLEGELNKWGFNYEAAVKRCAKGSNDEAYDCMQEKASQIMSPISSAWGIALRESVKERIDIKDVLIHPIATENPVAARKLWARVKELDHELRNGSYGWSAAKKECNHAMKEETQAIKDRWLGQLNQGETKVDGDQEICVEHANGMCPEGSYVTTKRRRDAVRGGAVLAVTYPMAKILLTPLGYFLGTSVAGPAGAAAGGLAAATVGAWLSFAVSYWASLGPKECACFMRDCSYVAEEGGCRITTEDESPTKNPYGKSLPMQGMKCELQYKSKDTCMMAECGNADYGDRIDDPGFLEKGINLYGKLGREGSGVYNCLSKNGETSGAVHLGTLLPTGQDTHSPNTPQYRKDLFAKLRSSSERFGEIPTFNNNSSRGVPGEWRLA